MQTLLSHLTHKEAFTAMSVVDTIISSTNVDDKTQKAMDVIQELLSNIYKNSLKLRSTDPYFQKL